MFNLTLDELGSWGLATGSISEVIAKTLFSQGQGPTYHIILNLWIRLFGEAPFVMRSLSLALSFLSLIPLYLSFKKFDQNYKISLTAYLSTPIIIIYFSLVRPYTLANLILCCLFYVSVHKKALGENKSILLNILLSFLLTMTHYLYCVALPFIALYHITIVKDYRSFFKSIAAYCLGMLGVIAISITNFSNKIGDSRSLEYTDDKTILIFLCYTLIYSSLGVAILSHLISRLSEKKLSKVKLRQILQNKIIIYSISSTLGSSFILFILSKLLNNSLFMARYLQIFALFSALGAGQIIKLSNVKSTISYFTISLIFCTAYYIILIKHEGKLLKTVFSKIESTQNECKLYASTGFIELIDINKLKSKDYESFLKAPINYYTKSNFKLLPPSISSKETYNYFINEIITELKTNKCSTLVLHNIIHNNKGESLLPIAVSGLKIIQDLKFKHQVIDHKEIIVINVNN